MKFAALLLSSFAAVFAAVFLMPSSASVPGKPKASAQAARADTFSCRVTGVHDGDGPIYCASGEKVRLTAVAAREINGTCSPGHPCPKASAQEAKAELNRLTRGQTLQCEKTGNSYGRVTAWCWREDGVEVNCAMIESGRAAYWKKYDPKGRLCQAA